MARQIIQAGAPPILWSNVDDAFRKVNANFLELYATILGSSGTVVDFTSMVSDILPESTDTYDLGSPSKRWKDLYLSGSSLYIGNAVVTSTGSSINLPVGSTVGGSLIKDPIEGSFKTIRVSGEPDIVADDNSDTLTFVGIGIGISLDADNDSVEFLNTGVRELIPGGGITVSGEGSITIENTGVRSVAAGPGMSVSAPNGEITITNAGPTRIVAGGGIGIDPTTGTGVITITNTSPNIAQNLWRFISVPGQTTLDPQNPIDTLTFLGGSGITITTDGISDSLTVANTGVISLSASSGISVSSASGSVVLTNTGVISLIAGDGISVSTSTGDITVSNTRPGFTNIAVLGESPIQADNTTDTLTLVNGRGITITTNATNDSLTVSINQDLDIKGSVFGDDSSLLVDGVGSTIVGPIRTSSLRTSESEIKIGIAAGETNQGVNTIAIGAAAGQANQGTSSIAIGGQAGNTAQGVSAVALGSQAGSINQGAIAVSLGTQAGSTDQGLGAVAVGTQAGITNQGDYAVAFGYLAGAINQPGNSIVINASGLALNGSAAGLFVDPIRSTASTGSILQYNTSTKEIIYSSTINANTVGYHIGDVKGSIVGDDSTLLVDGTNSRIIGTILSPTARITNDFTVIESWSPTPSTKSIRIDNTIDRIFETTANMSSYGSTIAPTIEFASYRSAPLNNNPAPQLVFRASTGNSINEVVSTINTVVTDITSGSVDSNVSISVKSNNSTVTPLTVIGTGIQVAGSVTATTFFQLPVYANDSARNVAIPFPSQGQVVFNQTGSKFQGYDGAAWVNLN